MRTKRISLLVRSYSCSRATNFLSSSTQFVADVNFLLPLFHFNQPLFFLPLAGWEKRLSSSLKRLVESGTLEKVKASYKLGKSAAPKKVG